MMMSREKKNVMITVVMSLWYVMLECLYLENNIYNASGIKLNLSPSFFIPAAEVSYLEAHTFRDRSSSHHLVNWIPRLK